MQPHMQPQMQINTSCSKTSSHVLSLACSRHGWDEVTRQLPAACPPLVLDCLDAVS